MRRPNHNLGTLLVVASLGLLAASPAVARADENPADGEAALLVEAAARAGFAAAALATIDHGDIAKATEILRLQLAHDLSRAGELADCPPDSETMTPHLVESLERAKSYVQDHSLDPELVEAADKAIECLDRKPSFPDGG